MRAGVAVVVGLTAYVGVGSEAVAQAVDLPQITVERSRARPAPRTAASPALAPIPDQVATQPRQTEPVATASEFIVSGETVNEHPVTRPAEALENAVPGLVITQHSGEGKANQYFLRGFNLDHGTDVAITVDGMPVNMRTHGHGQGYADLNLLIPELVKSVRVRKGPYFADEGDFSSAGAIHIDYITSLRQGLAQLTAGSFGYGRLLTAKSGSTGAGEILAAFEAQIYNGPWVVPDEVRKFNGLLRYSQGTADNGFSILGMAYSNRWNSTDQVAKRAIDTGVIDRFGTLDPTDGGNSSRFSLSGRWTHTERNMRTQAEAYVIRQTMTLFNNFTYFLDDPTFGDQFSQFDRRTVVGGNVSHSIRHKVGGFDSETTFGVQVRRDDISLGLLKTFRRQTLSTVRDDHVVESSVDLYAQNTTRWTDWVRTVVGVRGDYFNASVRSDTPANSGDAEAVITSPKASLIFGPFNKTEFYLSAGYGFHSNDVRGATITVDPNDKVTPQEKVPLLVRSKGAEVGVRTKAIQGLESTVALFILDYESELLFVGDAGTTEASRPSRRVGVEWTNHYQANSWLGTDLDFAFTRARFTNFDLAGDHVPGAPIVIASAGIVLGERTGWFGGAKLRYFGPRPLVEDDSVRSDPTVLVNANAGYRWKGGWIVRLDALNLFDAKSNQIDYFYTSRLPGEPLGGVDDRHVHPVEPLAIRLTLAGPLH